MKYVYILENDPKSTTEIVEALGKIDPKLVPRIFNTLESFANWIQLLTKEGKKAIAVGGFGIGEDPSQAHANSEAAKLQSADDDQLVLLVSNNEILGKKHLPLLKKAQDLFILKGLCTKEDPTALVITAFDNPDFDPQTIQARLVNNVIVKPFDKMILVQHLIFALSGRHPPSAYTLHNQKTSAIIEMLKDVHVEAYSEVGFITQSTRPIPIGAVAKYYGDVFTAGQTRSVFARCLLNEPHPKIPNLYRCGFTYFGTEPEQISTFRKNTQLVSENEETEYKYNWKPTKEIRTVHIAIVDPDEFGSAPLGGTLERTFSNVKIHRFRHTGELLRDLDPKSQVKATGQPAAFPQGNAKFFFEAATSKLVKIEPALEKGQKIFGMTREEFPADFWQWLPDSEKLKMMSILQSQFPKETMFLAFQHNQFEFFVKPDNVTTLMGEQGKKLIEVTLVELNETERNIRLAKAMKTPSLLDGVIVNERFVSEDIKAWDGIKERIISRAKKVKGGQDFTPLFFVVAKERKKDPDLRVLGKFFSDVFYFPVERSYFSKKMSLFFPRLEAIDQSKVEVKQFHKDEMIMVGNPIRAIQISEAGLVMIYYRAINIGSFRKFVLWFPMEIGLPIILSACNFNEPSETERGHFEHHFVFFGIRDFYLQHIRLWLRENYITSKSSE
jgi:hypothetical protein